MRPGRLRLVVRHLRACARHVAYNLRCIAQALRYGEIRATAVEMPEPDPALVTHPSYLCRCACGSTAGRAEHDAACPWAADMCPTCEGHGYCPGCQGDGTKADAPTGRACA